MITKTIRTVAGIATGALLLGGAPLLALAAPSIWYSASGNTPFSTLTVHGAGFAPEEEVHISLGLSETSATTDINGNFADAELTIPNVPSGVYYIIAVGQTSGMVSIENVWVSSFFPNASPSSWYIPPGSTLTWSGSGFAANETITVYDASDNELASFSTDSSGSFSGAGGTEVPYELRNSVTSFRLHAESSGVDLSYTLSIADLYPWSNPSTWYAVPGSPVTFSGGGFGAGEDVEVYLEDGTEPLATISTDSSGGFSSAGETPLPFSSEVGAAADFRLVGVQSGVQTLAPVTLADFYTSVTPSAWYAFPGDTITFDGSGFAGSETVAVSGAASGSIETNESGGFSGEAFSISGSGSSATFTFTGEQSGAETNVVITLGQRIAWLELSSYWAPSGSPLTVFGNDFSSGEEVELSSGGDVFHTAAADTGGDFAADSNVPFGPSGNLTITATGVTSGTTASVEMTRSPTYTDLQLGSYAVPAGSSVNFIGNGYLPDEPIEVMTDRTGDEVVHTFSANGSGSFNDSGYALPGDFAEGELTLTVRGMHSFDEKDITIWVAAAPSSE